MSKTLASVQIENYNDSMSRFKTAVYLQVEGLVRELKAEGMADDECRRVLDDEVEINAELTRRTADICRRMLRDRGMAVPN